MRLGAICNSYVFCFFQIELKVIFGCQRISWIDDKSHGILPTAMWCDNFQHRPTAKHHRAEKGSMKNSTSISASTCCKTSSGTSAWLPKKNFNWARACPSTKCHQAFFAYFLVQSCWKRGRTPTLSAYKHAWPPHASAIRRVQKWVSFNKIKHELPWNCHGTATNQ